MCACIVMSEAVLCVFSSSWCANSAKRNQFGTHYAAVLGPGELLRHDRYIYLCDVCCSFESAQMVT